MGTESNAHRWAAKIHKILIANKLNQADLANALGVSPATVSRWLSGKNEPTPQAYVALGNLAAAPDDAYFWERAGVQLKHSGDAPLKRVVESSEMDAGQFAEFAARRASGVIDEKQSIIAIPVLGVCAYADETPPREHLSLAQANVEDFLTAPSGWCPHPEHMISMHVCGDSMFPTMQNEALIVVNLATTNREQLNHELVVVSHRDLGLKVARLQHLSSCYVLTPANPSCMPIDITDSSKWKIIGKVLWWVTRDTIHQGAA